MNGAGTRKGPSTSGYGASYGDVPRRKPPPKALKNGNRLINGSARYSEMLNPEDPVSMHLLMEHALGDSQRYQVYSFEEIDELKKERSVLSSRIEATKRKLANEIKIRDAARSITRLNTPNGNDELAASVRRCEELSEEVGRLESREQEIQRLVLEHTAGILQMTHKGFLEKDGVPPASADNHLNGHVDPLLLDYSFDDRSFHSALDAMIGASHGAPGVSNFVQQTQAIAEVQHKLWDFNRRLRDAINQASAGRISIPAPPNPNPSDQQDPEDSLRDQLDYLEKGFDKMQKSQYEDSQSYKKSAKFAEEKLEDLNTHLRSIIARTSLDGTLRMALPPEVSGQGPEGQLDFLDQGLDTLEQHVQRLKDSHQGLQDQHDVSTSKSLAHEQKVGEYEQTFQGLWHKIVQGEENARKMDGASDSVPREKFSIETFASKVDLLNTRAANLRSQKDILSRQIQQQRELNSKSDGEKDAKFSALIEELEQTKKSLESAKLDGKATQDRLSAELQETRAQQDVLQLSVQEKSREAEKVHDEMQRFEGEMVRLQTELTVARAELDGAYGTRAQRAAEVAQHPALIAEVAALKEELSSHQSKNEALGSSNTELSARVQTLQKELSETIGEYEVMTKSSIEYEKERESLEGTIDELRDRAEALETQLSEEKVRMLGMKSPGMGGDQGTSEKGATSTSVLKNEFKKMMRETRAENARQLRAEQEERRKLETQIRALKKEQTPPKPSTPAKSSLSQSMTAT